MFLEWERLALDTTIFHNHPVWVLKWVWDIKTCLSWPSTVNVIESHYNLFLSRLYCWLIVILKGLQLSRCHGVHELPWLKKGHSSTFFQPYTTTLHVPDVDWLQYIPPLRLMPLRLSLYKASRSPYIRRCVSCVIKWRSSRSCEGGSSGTPDLGSNTFWNLWNPLNVFF